MDFEQLWAPWRIGYITGEKSPPSVGSQVSLAWEPGADQNCFLCRAIAESAPDANRRNLVVECSSLAVVMLNRALYGFFLRHRGLLFTAGAIPLHLLYYLYSAGSFAWVCLEVRWSRLVAGRRA